MSAATAPRSRYSAVAMLLHWTIALLILLNLAIGLRLDGIADADKPFYYGLHKSIGITVLLLTVLRLAWRLTHPRPPYPATMAPAERAAASTLHWGFYAWTLLLPLSGWIMVSASAANRPTILYGAVTWPAIGFVHALPDASRKAVDDAMDSAHFWLAWSLIALIVLHVAAALKHLAWDRDDVVARMLPLVRRRSRRA